MQDRIEKRVVIKAPRARVWRAISDKTEFGTWFGCRFTPGPFKAGESVHGKMTIKGFENADIAIEIVDVEPEHRLSYHWHPYAIDPKVDYTSEPMTIVTFTLADDKDGTLLTIVETGFDKLPLHRRDEALRMNDNGWTSQLRNIERHVTANR
jgi:uncharacterized protein YndB with AHSA1/START domain